MEETIVRDNLMNREGYSPYCGMDYCKDFWPRTVWDSKLSQFKCSCGWVSQFPPDFLNRYKQKWNK